MKILDTPEVHVLKPERQVDVWCDNGGAAFKTVTSQHEALNLVVTFHHSVWSLHDLSVPACTLGVCVCVCNFAAGALCCLLFIVSPRSYEMQKKRKEQLAAQKCPKVLMCIFILVF